MLIVDTSLIKHNDDYQITFYDSPSPNYGSRATDYFTLVNITSNDTLADSVDIYRIKNSFNLKYSQERRNLLFRFFTVQKK